MLTEITDRNVAPSHFCLSVLFLSDVKNIRIVKSRLTTKSRLLLRLRIMAKYISFE